MRDIIRQATNPTNPTNGHKRGRPRTGGIYRRGGVYWLRYQIEGERVAESLGVKTMREAEAEAARRLAPIRAADHAATLRAIEARIKDADADAAAAFDAVHPAMTFGAGWAEYLKSDAVPAGKRSLGNYEGYWNACAEWLAKNHPATVAPRTVKSGEKWKPEDHPEAVVLRAVSPDMAAAYIKTLVGQLKGQTVNKHLQFLRATFGELKKAARLSTNPFEGIKRRPKTEKSKRPLTAEEVRAVIESAAGEMKTLLMLGAFTGLRLGDCATLENGEVDLRRGIIRRIPRKTAYRGADAAVVVGIPAVLGAHLAGLPRVGRYLLPGMAQEYNAGRWSRICKRVQAHFQSAGIETLQDGTGAGSAKKEEAGRPIPGAGTRAGVLAGFHSLRHFFISTLAQAGAPMAVLQKLAGHGNPIMTDHYLHLTPEAARMTAAKMPELLGDGKERKAAREPLPAWAVAELRKMTGKNWAKVRGGMLEGVAE